MPLAQKFPTSVLLQEQRDEYNLSCVYFGKRKHPRLYSFYRFSTCANWKTETSCRRPMATGTSGTEEESSNSEQLALQTDTNPSSSSNMESAAMETEKSMNLQMHKLLDKVWKVRRLCIKEGKDFPTKEEIAGRMDITVDKLEKLLILERWRNPILEWNMDEIVNPEDEDPWAVYEKELLLRHVCDLMENLLTLRQRQVVRLRYGFEDGRRNPYSEISVKLGMSREGARKLEKNALRRMRQRLESEGARETYSFLAYTTTTL